MRRHLVTLSAVIALSVLLFVVGTLSLSNTDSGSRWLLQQLTQVLTAQITVADINGRLRDRLVLTDLSYHSADSTLTINQLVLHWQPKALLSGSVHLLELQANGVTVNISTNKTASATPPFNAQAPLSLPVQLLLDKVLLTDVSVTIDKQRYVFSTLQLSADTTPQQLNIQSLALTHAAGHAQLHGTIGLNGGLPITLHADWQQNSRLNGLWQGHLDINGDMTKLLFSHQLATPFKLALQGSIDNVIDAPRLTTTGDWQQMAWSLTDAVQLHSTAGHFALVGWLNDYQLTLNAQLKPPNLPVAQINFNGTGSLHALDIKQLSVTSINNSALQLAGQVDWQQALSFTVNARGQHVNPAWFMPELIGDLTFNSQLNGNLAPTALQLNAVIKTLSGQLRGIPVSASGTLQLIGEQLRVDKLRLVSGSNSIAIDGALGQPQDTLKLTLALPKLHQLWSTLGGAITGSGQLRGAWRNPSVSVAATATQLQLGAQHAAKLALAVDYQADSKQQSSLHIVANAINSGALYIKQLQVDGQGTATQHQFNATLRTAKTQGAMALNAGFTAHNWQTTVTKLAFQDNDLGAWQLRAPARIDVTQQADTLAVTVANSCLVQQAAAICVKGQGNNNGDFTAALTTTALPLNGLQTYLAQPIVVTSVLTGSAELTRQHGNMNGRYQWTLPPSTLKIADKTMALGTSTLSGDVKGERLTTEFALALIGADYVRGNLQLNLGKSQALFGQVSANINDFAPLNAVIPQVATLTGQLQAALTLRGTLQKPRVNGMIDLTQGAVATEQLKLQAINVHAQLTDNNSIQLQGTATPVLTDSKLANTLTSNGILTLAADIHSQNSGLNGHYQLTLPQLILKSGRALITKATLSGDIKDDSVNSDIAIALIDNDYLRGNLRVDLGATQALSGQLSAAITPSKLITPLMPQFSNIQGAVTAAVTIAGTTQQPQLDGIIQLKRGAVDVVNLGLNVHDITVKAQANRATVGQVNIQGSATSGTGSVKLDGVVGLDTPSHLTIIGDNIEIAKLPEAQINVSPKLTLNYAHNHANISGQLTIPKALLVLKQLPENAVTVSKDEQIIGVAKSTQVVTAPLGIDTDIAVELGQQVKFSGQGLQTNLAGHLNVKSQDGKLTMTGNVDMTKASYQRFGQTLTVRKGRFLFNGQVDNPWLEVEAIRLSKNKKITAVLSLSGLLKQPKTKIYAEPAVSEADALAYLITGTALNQVSKTDGNKVASAALSYGASQVSWLTSKWGLDEFSVEEGETLHDTLVTVGRYLTPDFYVGTKVGLFNKQALLILKHKLFDNVTVETQTGTSKRIKLNYEFDAD